MNKGCFCSLLVVCILQFLEDRARKNTSLTPTLWCILFVCGIAALCCILHYIILLFRFSLVCCHVMCLNFIISCTWLLHLFISKLIISHEAFVFLLHLSLSLSIRWGQTEQAWCWGIRDPITKWRQSSWVEREREQKQTCLSSTYHWVARAGHVSHSFSLSQVAV